MQRRRTTQAACARTRSRALSARSSQ
jgi:hypothetical protein